MHPKLVKFEYTGIITEDQAVKISAAMLAKAFELGVCLAGGWEYGTDAEKDEYEKKEAEDGKP